MTNLHCIIPLLLLCGTLWTAPEFIRAASDSAAASSPVAQDHPAPAANEKVLEDDFSPGLGIFALLMVILFAICLAFAILAVVAAIAILGSAAILVALGIVSTSVLAGFIGRHPSAGLRAFFIQMGAVAGIPCGIVMSWLVVWLLDLEVGLKWSMIAGAFGGLLAGVGIAILFNLAWGRAVRWAVARYSSGI